MKCIEIASMAYHWVDEGAIDVPLNLAGYGTGMALCISLPF